jgi:glycerol-3-phosphate acyltransferase PlsY
MGFNLPDPKMIVRLAALIPECQPSDDVPARLSGLRRRQITAAAARALGVLGCIRIYTHRSNIARMLQGSEYRVRRLWLARR